MSRSLADALAELIAMRASGEISPEEFAAARGRLRGDVEASPTPNLDSARPAVGVRSGATARTAANTVEAGAAPAPAKPKKLRFRHALGISVALLLAIGGLGTFAGRTVYERADYGDAWPYPNFDRAVVRCAVRKFGSTDRPVATVELGGVTYGLNGPALGIYPDPRPFEPADKSQTASTVGAMIDDALTNICRWKQ